MRILHIARWCCIRTLKQVISQQEAGWDVTLMAASTGHPDLHAMVSKAIGWQTQAAMRGLISAYDVIVVHTTIATHDDAIDIPYAIGPTAKQLVWDCHDFVSTQPRILYDAIVVPSKGYADKLGAKATVVYSKVPECLLPEVSGDRMLYHECIALNATLCASEPWGNYSDIQSINEHCPVYIYPSGDDISGHEHLNVMRRLPYRQLLQKLTHYPRHWCGSANADVSIHDCVTNKFWECLACESKPLFRNSDEMQELYDNCYDIPTMEQEFPAMKEAYGL